MNTQNWIERNRKYTVTDGATGFSINVAGMNFVDDDVEALSAKFAQAHEEMVKIEAGEIKNPDENRKVTHFTDRAVYPGTGLFAEVEAFAGALALGEIRGSTGKNFENAVINGIGGSALGPQLLQFAMNGPYWNELGKEKRKNRLKIYFTDNTDPAGIEDLMDVLDLEKTLIVTISKSGGTQESKNNMIAFSDAYKSQGIDFAKHACAITMSGSELDQYAKSEAWLKIFPMAESIGGRTSETSIVGHLPAALAGIDFRSFIKGACHMDVLTRNIDFRKNPSYLLAGMWFIAGNGRGDKNMVIVPYADRLVLLSRYLQQLVMESLGKEKDFSGKTVYQGLNVFGNKGGTDAHAFIQQLNDGRNDFFITFIEVLKDARIIPIDRETTMSDYLHGFLEGLSKALLQKNRQVIRITLAELNAYNLGMIIALYERAVAFYAELVGINAFHQPGVQAYKLASKGIIKLCLETEQAISKLGDFEGTIAEIARKTGLQKNILELEGIIAKFAANPSRPLPGFKISRRYDDEKGWIYKISTAA